MTKWINLQDASALCDCCDLTIANALRKGKIEAIKDTRTGRPVWQINEESLLAWNKDRLKERKMMRSKKCKVCGKWFKTFDKLDNFCSYDCEKVFDDASPTEKKRECFTSWLTKDLTFAQQCRIIDDLFHPETAEEREKAVSKWMNKSNEYYPLWLKEHSLSEISGKAVAYARVKDNI